MKPTLNILHWPANRYTSSHETDIRKLFARVIAERKKASDLAQRETEVNQERIQSIFAKRIREAK